MAKRGQPHHIFSSQHLFSFSFYPKGKKKEDVAGKRKLVGLGQLALQKRREKPHSAEIISLFGGCGFSYSFSSAGLSFSSDVFLLAPRLLQISFSFWRNRNAIFRASVPKGKLHLKERPKGKKHLMKNMERPRLTSKIKIFSLPF